MENEKKRSKKLESSRLNVLYVVDVLSKYSDEEHPVSASDIKNYVDREFASILHDDDESVISVDTVKRILDELADRWFPVQRDENMYDIEYKFGYYIHSVMKEGDEFVTYKADRKQAPKKYYYYESNLKIAELVTIKDAMETYSFFSEDDMTEIIQKIIRLRPMSFPKSKYRDEAGAERDENSMVLMNIDYLNRIIKNKKGAKITYCSYDMNKKLVPRKGYPKVVEPMHLMWGNGYYYLLAYNLKYGDIVSIRVDRITNIEEVELAESHRKDNFNPVKYRHEHPVMFSGEKQKVIMLCRDTGHNHIMNSVIDVFGKNIRVSEAETELVNKYVPKYTEKDKKNGIKWLRISFESTVGGLEMWATQYCADCIIISPEESRNRVRNNIIKGMEYYS